MRADEIKRQQKQLVQDHSPSLLQVRRRNQALDAFLDHEEYGLPYEGGSRQQPYQWKRTVNFAKSVQRAAQWEIRKIEAQDSARTGEY